MRLQTLGLLSAILFGCTSCGVELQNIRGCSGVNGFEGIGAVCQDTNDDTMTDLDVQAWLDFLYARPELVVPDPDDPTKTKTLPAKGPAVAFSSLDFQKLKTAIGQLCVKVTCNYDSQKIVNDTLNRMTKLQDAANARSLQQPLVMP